MVKERMDLLELMRKRGVDGDVDFLREALRVLVEEIMEADVSSRTGAGYGERNPERVTQRNGYRSRAWDTRVGTMELQIPKLREGSYFPSLLEPRRRSERALLAVIQQAYVEGVSTRRVDDLVKALGCEGISKSQVSRICQELDGVVESFLGRPLDGGSYPYLWLDALTQKVREAGRIVNVSVVVATAVNSEGKREIVGMDVGTSEDGAFWLAFLRSLVARGLGGVELVVSDAHQGLRDAIATVFGGASWQRCRTYFMTNLLTRVPRSAQPWVATMVRTIYQQPSPQEVHAQLERVIAQVQDPFPQVASRLDEAEPDVLRETVGRVRYAGANGRLTLRADSGFYTHGVVSVCRKMDVRFSITIRQHKSLRNLIEAIPEDAWTPIPYWMDGAADVAETTCTPFRSEPDAAPVRLIVRRVKPTPGSQLALFASYSYHGFITDRDGEMLELEADHRRHAEIENAIRDLKHGVGLNHLPSGRFAANAAWLAVQVMAHNLARWTARIGLGEQVVTTKTLRRRFFSLAGRITRSARHLTLHLPQRWPWEAQFDRALARLRALPLPA